jgi:4-amino-4-deoxy-L-arabinose transferase-like glycosyltransferase
LELKYQLRFQLEELTQGKGNDPNSLIRFMLKLLKNYYLLFVVQDSYLNWFIFIGLIINAVALFTQVMDQDSAMYASIAKRIVTSNDWINLYSDGRDWLDKPHLPLWISALSFKIFGISPFSYKLPSFLIWLLGTIYLYKLGSRIYSLAIAKLSVVIYLTSLYVILSNYDVRAEGFLSTFIVASTYHIYQLYKGKGNLHLILSALYTALAVMTKGIFFSIVIASGFVIYWMISRQWNEFIKLRWWLMMILTYICILPELYCLYSLRR